MIRAGVALLLAGLIATPALAQSTLDAPANLAGAWVATPGIVQFNLLHRFDISPPPARKLNNSPTLLLALGVTPWATAGFVYGSNSDLVAAYPNEWEWFGRLAGLRQGAGAPLDATLQGGYNLAARSADFALTVTRGFGRFRLLGTGALLSSAFDSGQARWVVGGGASIRITPGLAVSGDVTSLTDRRAGEDVTWSAGFQVGIPSSPHSLSLHATNVGTRTLQGLARGSGRTRFGFEYTIPIALRRRAQAALPHRIERVDPGPQGVVETDIRQLAYARAGLEVPAGTTIRWTNRDPLPHTVTADDATFDSALIQPGAAWQHVFDQPGTYHYYCTPHPFMKGVIVVR